MPVPNPADLELPILTELAAVGGEDGLKYLETRLHRYAPALEVGERDAFRRCVLRAGALLGARGQLTRARGRWRIAARGQARLEQEGVRMLPEPTPFPPPPSHADLQERVVQIGRLLGYDAALEQEFYDVVWRERPGAPRYSHVFEVQVAGSVDSALARLQQAWERSRSLPILVVADRRSWHLAEQRLAAAFHPLASVIRLLDASDITRLHTALLRLEPCLAKLLPIHA